MNWLLIVHQTFHHLPEPTGRNWLVSSNNFMDWDKFIPFCDTGTFRGSLQWPETTSGTLHKPLGLRQPMLSGTDGHFQEVWWLFETPASCQDKFHFSLNTGKFQELFVFLYLLITLGERNDGSRGTTAFVRTTNPTGNIEERTRHF